MIICFIMCQIILSLIHQIYSDSAENLLTQNRWSVADKNASPKQLLNFDKNRIVQRGDAPKASLNFKRDSVSYKTETPTAQLEDEECLFDLYQPCKSTKKPRFKCIETPPPSRPVNLKFQQVERIFKPTRKFKVQEITVLPLTIDYASPQVDLVFPLEGSPPPSYNCYKIDQAKNDRKIKVYRVCRPELPDIIPGKDFISEKCSSNKSENKLNSSKIKRQGYWLELQSPTSTNQYTRELHSESKVDLFRPKSDKSKKHKLKKKKKKKNRLLETTDTTTYMNNKGVDYEYQTETSSQGTETDKFSIVTNDTEVFDIVVNDQEQLFIKPKEYNTTVDNSSSYSNQTESDSTQDFKDNQFDKPLTNMSFAVDNEPDKDKSAETEKPIQSPLQDQQSPLKPSKDSTKEKPPEKETSWDSSGVPSSLRDIFSISSSRPMAVVTQDPSHLLSTKFAYGHELHV